MLGMHQDSWTKSYSATLLQVAVPIRKRSMQRHALPACNHTHADCSTLATLRTALRLARRHCSLHACVGKPHPTISHSVVSELHLSSVPVCVHDMATTPPCCTRAWKCHVPCRWQLKLGVKLWVHACAEQCVWPCAACYPWNTV